MDRIERENNLKKLQSTLRKLSSIDNFSVGLHSTKGTHVAESICEKGLFLSVRAVEGTLKIRGKTDKISLQDLDYFYESLGTDVTVVVAIPSFFEANRIDDNEGGYKALCEFSRFVDTLNIRRADRFLEFCRDGNPHNERVVPAKMVVGYYNKNFELTLNPNCWLFDRKFERPSYFEDLEARVEKQKEEMQAYVEFLRSLRKK